MQRLRQPVSGSRAAPDHTQEKDALTVSDTYAGVGEAVVTPAPGTPLLEPRGVPSTGAHDDLSVRALALGVGGAMEQS